MLTGVREDLRAPERRSGFFPGFDGLRAIAATSVLLYHVGYVVAFTFLDTTWGRFTARGDVGVIIFFVISGFLLYRPFVVARLAGRPGPLLRPYLARRLLRIVPAYWLALTVLTVVFHTTRGVGGWNIPIYYGFAQIYFQDHALGGLGVAWSLCTEMSFYLFLPLYAWLLARIGARRSSVPALRVEFAGLVVLVAIGVGFRLGIASYAWPPNWQFWLPANIDVFAAGMLLAVVSAHWERGGREPAVVSHRLVAPVSWGLAFLAFWIVSTKWDLPLANGLMPITTNQQMFQHLGYGIVAFLLVLPAVVGAYAGGPIRRFLASRVMRFLGIVSYGIYLWHEAALSWVSSWLGMERTHIRPHWSVWNPPFLVLGAMVLAVAAAVAALSHYIVERPLLLRAPRGTRRLG